MKSCLGNRASCLCPSSQAYCLAPYLITNSPLEGSVSSPSHGGGKRRRGNVTVGHAPSCERPIEAKAAVPVRAPLRGGILQADGRTGQGGLPFEGGLGHTIRA